MTKSEDYQKVASKNDLKEGGLLRVEAKGKPIVLAMVKGKVYAIDAVCSHEGGPLEEGTLQGYELKCPWHYAIFDVRNAKVSDQTVWATDLQSYDVKVDEATGDVLLRLLRKSEKEGLNEATTQQAIQRKDQDSDNSEKKYYEEEERKVGDNKLSLELISKERLQGTDIRTLRLGRGSIDFRPGQYAFFTLSDVSGDAKGPTRHFSIASSPTEQGYLLISTIIRDSPYKQRLSSLKEGAHITAWGPEGEFVLHDDDSKPAVFLSGGIGVTPFRSMIKYATDKQLPIRIAMFDSNKNVQSILYKEEFDKWARQNKNVKIVYTITEQEEQLVNANSWTGERGRIDKPMLERHLTRDEIDNATFYICGPPGMLKAMQDLLQKQLQIPKSRLKIEAFTGY